MRKMIFVTFLFSSIANADEAIASVITGEDNTKINALAATTGLAGACFERGLYVTETMFESLLAAGEKQYGDFYYSEFFAEKVESWFDAAMAQDNISNECLEFATGYNEGYNK